MTDNKIPEKEVAQETKQKCRYCMKEIPAGEEKHMRIRVNRGWTEEVFCSGKCGGYYQMGCEG